MRFYRQTVLPDAPYAVTPSDAYFLHTPHYFEVVLPRKGGGFACYYVLARDETSVCVCVCLMDAFTDLVTTYLSANEVVQTALAQAYRETWPRLYQLLGNGFRGDFRDAALTVLVDPDDSKPKWFVATVVDQLPSLDREHVFNDRTQAALIRVDVATERALQEFRTWSIDTSRYLGKIFRTSVSRDLVVTALFMRDNFSHIMDLLELVEALGDA